MLTLPEMVLRKNSIFWQRLVRNQENSFERRLACIAIYKAHVIWGWKEFQKDYCMLGALKDAFSNIPMLVFSATITPTVLEYIHSSLKFAS